MKKVWLVEFPVSKYNEDVKALARKNDLVIYDVKYKGSINPDMVEDNPPKLTEKGKKRRSKKSDEAPVVEAVEPDGEES